MLQEEARKLDISAREFQEVAWAGSQEAGSTASLGKPMIEHFNEMIERTSRILHIPPHEVVRGYIRQSIPIFGVGGVAAGGLARPKPER